MRKLRYFSVAMMAFVASANVQAQSIYEMIENDTYYADPNYMWYEFGRTIGGETAAYTMNETSEIDNRNGWVKPSGVTAGMDIYWNQSKGVLCGTAGEPMGDNGYTSRMIKMGTPQLKYNMDAYPIVAVKFGHMPACGEGGWQDYDRLGETGERMYGGVRFQAVERKETSINGNNGDFWLRIPRNAEDAAHMANYKNDNVDDWLTVYTPNEHDTIYIFNLRYAVPRNHGANNYPTQMSRNTEAVVDFYFVVTDVLDRTDILELEWVRSFYEVEEAIEYADDLYAQTGIKQVQRELDATISSVNGRIVVSGVENPTIEVLNFLGQTVAKAQANELNVAPGQYIVRVSAEKGIKTVKLMHK